MSDADVLLLLKLHLQIDADNTALADLDKLLQHKIGAAKAGIKDEGITLDLADAGDLDILLQYSAWLYDRRDAGDAMPRMLRLALNNRKLKEGGAADGEA